MAKHKKKSAVYAQNLSHELLTPLAVIRSKVELLLQSPNLDQEDLKSLDDILRNVRRMRSLNQALIQLSKIDNEVYEDREAVNIQSLIEEILDNFEDQIRFKELKVRVIGEVTQPIKTNKNLMNLLVLNLIKNAVMHNKTGGELIIELKNNAFLIKNSLDPMQRVPKKPFKRFNSSKSESLGLGLAIVKSTLDYLDLEYDLSTDENWFIFSVSFQ